MCGIAGAVWTNTGEPVVPQVLAAMTRTLRERGPDGEGFLIRSTSRGGAALGHRRLAVIDLATGAQPMSNEDGSKWVIFNGEIYNFRQLRDELTAAGHVFRTRTDTEVIVHLYEEYGDACVEQLRGMFAFAVWNERTGRLLLARDRMGQKPLVYRREPGRILFASQLRAIMAVPGVPREVDPAAIHAYLRYQCVPSPLCAIEGVQKLPPGHIATYDNGTLDVRRYWSPVRPRRPHVRAGEYKEQLRHTLAEATKLRMISDVPVGAFLSGGTDSTIIVGLMSRCAGASVKTFSIGFRDPVCDESAFARQAALHLRTDHRELVLDTPSPDLANACVSAFDEPFADASAIPTYLVSELGRREVTVSLTGDGGDELFGGYTVYQRLRWLDRFDRLPRAVRALATSPLLSTILDQAPIEAATKLSRVLKVLADTPEGRIARSTFGGFSRRVLPHLLRSEFTEAVRQRCVDDCVLSAFAACDDRDFVSQAMLVHQLTYLPDVLLVKVDVASMAHGLECRSPLLDHRVVELANELPLAAKLQRGVTKAILKQAFEEFLPPQLVRRGKQGFAIPLDTWIRTVWRDAVADVLSSRSAFWRSLFNTAAIDAMLREHMSGRADYRQQLWTLYCLELWHRNYMRPDRRDGAFAHGSSFVECAA